MIIHESSPAAVGSRRSAPSEPRRKRGSSPYISILFRLTEYAAQGALTRPFTTCQPADGLRRRGRSFTRSYSTVTDLARFLGLSMSQPFSSATW